MIGSFSQVWLVDFEFRAEPGERPDPVCLVALELGSGAGFRLWRDELVSLESPPYPVGPDSLFVAYYASAELGCHLALGWPIPQRILDLYTEFRCETNGRMVPCGSGLIGALAYHGIPSIAAVEKEAQRNLVLRGGPWSASERNAILDYCASDVDALRRLLPMCLPKINLPRALLRGRYMAAAASMEHTGVPIDVGTLQSLREHWDYIKAAIVSDVDSAYGVYDKLSFREARFLDYLAKHGIPWPRLASGRVALDDETFKEMARTYPLLAPLRQLRVSLSQLRLNDLAVGADGRNRVLLSAFRTKSGRNAPSNSRFIFGTAAWVRSLIQPPPGRALAYVDWSQQEFGIAAALSGDGNMVAAYESGDPYMAFAIQAGAAPRGSTRTTHPQVREQYKACALGVQYGIGESALARQLGQQIAFARQTLEDHHRTYRRFWAWSDAAAAFFDINGFLWSVYGWMLFRGPSQTERTARNFPMQANGAEMLRLAACLMTERGIHVCAPVHDAFLVEGDTSEINDVVQAARGAMANASESVLSGFRLRTDVVIIDHPERYRDARGDKMWGTVVRRLKDAQTRSRG